MKGRVESFPAPIRQWTHLARNTLLRFPLHGGSTMPTLDLLPSLLLKINENQLALEAAIMELSNWIAAP